MICGLREKDEAGVAVLMPPGEESRDEVGLEEPPMKEAVEESRSFEGIFDCEFEGEKWDWKAYVQMNSKKGIGFVHYSSVQMFPLMP